MTCWAIIPVKGPDEGKRRLAGVLDDEARRRLVAAMLGKVVAAVQHARGIDRMIVVGPSRHDLSPAITLHPDPGGGLNAALTDALAAAAGEGASRAVIVAADLPQLTRLDVELLAAAAPGKIAIAPDRHETGTNALSLPLPAARDFAFAFGPDSFARHNAAAGRLGLEVEIIAGPGLMRDIDTPDDLADAAELQQG
jgi:2-phospho-L-lactate/phosphoenolpyruvate guanylyltransferase